MLVDDGDPNHSSLMKSDEIQIEKENEDISRENTARMNEIDSHGNISPMKSAIPWKHVYILVVFTLAEGISFNFYNTIVALMMRNQFNIPAEKVGYYVGYITTSFYVGQLLFNFPLSWLSDRVGRKPVLILGLSFNIICQIFFGSSPWIWLCIGIRFVNGLTNSSLPVSKCFVRETSDTSNQAYMFSFREIGFALGAVIAPLLGGIFSRPADISWLKGTVFASEFFIRFPYALVCYMAACINIISLLVVIFFMEETRIKPKFEVQEVEMEELATEGREDTDTNTLLETKEKETKELSTSPIAKVMTVLANKFSFMDKSTTLTISLYAIFALMVMLIIQAFPVWASRPVSEDGLGFEESQIGTIFSAGAFAALLFQIVLYAPFDSLAGSNLSFRLTTVFFFPLVFCLPFLSFFAGSVRFVFFCLMVMIMILYCVISWGYVGINVLINNAARSDSVGSVNGIGTAMASLMRVIAPVLGTSLFAFSANADKFYPFNYMMVFHLSACICIVCFLLSLLLPSRLNSRVNK